jgi:hypothetical protein
MEIKVNRVIHSEQLKLLKDKISLINVLIKKTDNDSKNYISLESAIAIKNNFPELKFSAYFDDDFSVDEINNIAETNGFDYIEAFCPDFPKARDFEKFKNKIMEIRKPKIIGFFFIFKDEYSTLKDEKYFKELLNYDVEYFQIELDSIIYKDFLIDGRIQKRIVNMFEDIPVLYTDSFKLLTDKINNKIHDTSKGIYFNLNNDIKNSRNSTLFKTFEIYRIIKDKV